MDTRREWHDSQTLPSSMVPKDMLASGSYRSSGFNCRACSWRTDKVGYSGRQAVRAHSRVHAYDRRSWQRPLGAVTVLLIMAAFLAALGHLELLRFESLAEIPAPRVMRLAFFAAPLALAAGVAVVTAFVWNEISPSVLWTFRGVAAFAFAPVCGVVAAEIGVVEMKVGPPELALAAGSSVAMAVFSCGAGYFRLMLRRRMQDPTGYTELVNARDDDAEMELRYRAREAQRKAAERSNSSKKPPPRLEPHDAHRHEPSHRREQRSHGPVADQHRGDGVTRK